jgi:L-seryl-tRNA(Ser) seleniumtransferase
VIDLGSGAMSDVGLSEPTVDSVVRAGADVVCFSADKLLGGPQAGLIVGSSSLAKKFHASPLYRALRLGKTELFLLEEVLRKHLCSKPTLTAMFLTAPAADVRMHAEKLCAGISTRSAKLRVVEGTSAVGGGASPSTEIPTFLVEIQVSDPERLVRELWTSEPAIMVRKENKKVLLDLRTVLPEELALLGKALQVILSRMEA